MAPSICGARQGAAGGESHSATLAPSSGEPVPCTPPHGRRDLRKLRAPRGARPRRPQTYRRAVKAIGALFVLRHARSAIALRSPWVARRRGTERARLRRVGRARSQGPRPRLSRFGTIDALIISSVSCAPPPSRNGTFYVLEFLTFRLGVPASCTTRRAGHGGGGVARPVSALRMGAPALVVRGKGGGVNGEIARVRTGRRMRRRHRGGNKNSILF